MIGLAMMLAAPDVPANVLGVGDQEMVTITLKSARQCKIETTVRPSLSGDVESGEIVEPGSRTVVSVIEPSTDKMVCFLSKQAGALAKMAERELKR